MPPSTDNPGVGVERTMRALLRSSNPAARDTLLAAVGAPSLPIAIGAVRVLALRDDRAGHRHLIDRIDQLPPEVRAALDETVVTSPMARSFETLLLGKNAKRSLAVADLALSGHVIDCLPAIVRSAVQAEPDKIAPYADAALRLSQELRKRVDQVLSGERPEGADPAFARRAAVNALTEALGAYAEHQNANLLESLLLLAPHDEPAMLQALRQPTHPAYKAMLETLRRSEAPGAVGLLATMIKQASAGQDVLEIAARRTGKTTLSHFFTGLGTPIGMRAKENAARIAKLAWLDEARLPLLLELGSAQQATAVEFAAASKSSRTELALLIQQLLLHGEEEAKLAACWAIDKVPERLAGGLLDLALDTSVDSVITIATKLLRTKKGPGGSDQLIDLLDHPEEEVRRSAQQALPEVNFSNYRNRFDEMDQEEQLAAGELVGKGDATVLESLDAELTAGAVSRRLKGIEMIDRMGLASKMADRLVRGLADRDVGVRAEAARLLGQSAATPEVVQALATAMHQDSTAVRGAAQQSAYQLGVLDAVERMIEELLEEEF